MSWLDDAISWISPQWGAKRIAYREYSKELQRFYDAGIGKRLNENWSAIGASGEETDKYNRDIIRNRARDLERNSDIANSVLNAIERNVIGAGFVLRAKTPDAELNKSIEKLWKRWSKARNCDVTGTQSFMEMMRMAIVRKKVDGGILIKKCYTDGGMMRFKLQTIEVDEIDSTATGQHGDNKIVSGIEYNKYNKIVGYWIKQYDVDGWQINKSQYVPAKDMIFLFTKRRPSQIREMSDLTHVISRVRDANEYMTAISVKERITACLAVFIKKALPVNTGRINTNSSGDYAGKRLSPGMIQELNPGDDVQVVNPSGQATDSAGMIQLHQRMIGAGLGLSYETTSRDMSHSNYSSARQGAIEDELTYKKDKEKLIETVFDEVYETFLIQAWLEGLLNIPDFWERKMDYMEHEWVGIPKPWVDPIKEANANKTAVSSGVKTYQQICAEQGYDWKRNIDEIAEAAAYATEKGISLEEVIYGKKIGNDDT